MATYLRWIAIGPDLQAAKSRKLRNSRGANTALWIFTLGKWSPSAAVAKDRVLVAIKFTSKGEALLRDEVKWIRFPGASFKGEAKHPDGIIVKSNEPGAYGIGRELLKELNSCIAGTRVATEQELARALGKTTSQVRGIMQLQ